MFLENILIMETKKEDLYSRAHLFVAAMRVCERQTAAAPSLDDVCRLLSFSLEQGNFLCRKLEDLQIIEVVEGSFGNRLFIRDHLKIENIPRGRDASRLEEELKKFQDSQKAFSKKIESIRSREKEKKKSRFSEMEKKLKQELEKKSKNP